MSLASSSIFPAIFLFLSATSALPACALAVVDGEESDVVTPTTETTTEPPVTPICKPGSVVQCYGGPPATEGVGACFGGVRMCSEDGTSWSECKGEVLPLAEDCSVGGDSNCDGVFGCTGKNVWARDFVTDDGVGEGSGVAADALGNVFVTGSLSGHIEFAGLQATSDESVAFIAKLDAFGTGLWMVQASAGSGGASVAPTADGGVIMAATFYKPIEFGGLKLSPDGPYDIFVAKFDSAGNLEWLSQFGGPGYQWPQDMEIDGDGNILIIGGLHDGSDFGDGYKPSVGETDFFVLKLDPEGNKVYSKQFGTKGYDYGLGIAAAYNGDAVIAGSFAGTLDLGKGPLVSAGSDDIFVARLLPDGAASWSKRFGGGNHDLAKGVTVTQSDIVIVAGLSSGAVDFGGGPISGGGSFDAFVTWLWGDGTFLNARAFGAPGATAEVLDVATDVFGQAVVTGHMTGTLSLGGAPLSAAGAPSSLVEDVFVAKYDYSGEQVYSFVYGDKAQQLASSVFVDDGGNMLVAGYFRGEIDFGTGPLDAPPNGQSDLFVAKLLP